MRISVQLNREDLSKLQLPIIVERWDRLSPRSRHKYREEFTIEEQRLIRYYYKKAYKWYLVTGYPEVAHMLPKTYNLLQRAVDFFAGV